MIEKLFIIVLATIATIGMNINLDKNLNFMDSLKGNEISIVLIFVAFTFLIYKAFQYKDRRLNVIALILGFIFASFEIIGNSIVNYGDLTGILYNKTSILKNIIKFIYYLTIVYSIIKVIFPYFARQKDIRETKEYKIFTSNKISIFVVFMVVIIFWIPYFLKYFPGIVGFDTLEQIKEAVGVSPMWNGSPICTTLTLKLIIDLTMQIFNDLTISIAICTILKMIFMALIVSYSIYYLAKKTVNSKIRLIVLLFFAITPIFPLYAISLEKDSLFASVFLIDFILLFEFITNKEVFIKSKFKIIMSFIFVLLTALIRHNGIYIYILLIPFLYIILRKNYMKLSIFIVSTLISIYLINTILFAIFDVKQSSSLGLLCMPMQAMARLVKNNDNNLTDEEKYEMNLFVEYDELADSYNPTLSDPEMGHFREEYLQTHKIQYLLLNIKLFMHYPNYYIESILCNTSGYWFPENIKLIFDRGVISNTLGIETRPLISNNKILDTLDLLPDNRQIPVIGMFFSPGFTLWIFITLIFYVIYQKKYSLLVALLPSIYNYIIILLGPSNTEFRYIIPMYMPLSVMYCLLINEINIEKESDKNENSSINTML